MFSVLYLVSFKVKVKQGVSLKSANSKFGKPDAPTTFTRYAILKHIYPINQMHFLAGQQDPHTKYYQRQSESGSNVPPSSKRNTIKTIDSFAKLLPIR
jgi:hypothetical protein